MNLPGCKARTALEQSSAVAHGVISVSLERPPVHKTGRWRNAGRRGRRSRCWRRRYVVINERDNCCCWCTQARSTTRVCQGNVEAFVRFCQQVVDNGDIDYLFSFALSEIEHDIGA